MNNSRRGAIAASLIALASLSARAQPQRRLRVVASFSILADIVRNVGGDAIELATLVGPDADAHVFEPTPADAKRLADAELVIVNGLGFEGWLDRLVRASGYKGPIAVASAGISPRRMGRQADPHAWQDLTHARRYVHNVRDALANARRAEAEGFTARAAAYTERIAVLDSDLRKTFDAIPPPQRRLITAHDAFGYFGAAYGIEFLAPQGMNTDSQPSAAAVARLIEQIRKQGVRAVFVENISDPRLVERIAREGGAVVGGRLYSDALSAPGTEADTYLKLFAHNASAIAGGLQAPRNAVKN
jgi:zinc/manganese transport system substrate-binding protein